jgi:hypothetical protein
MNSEHQAVQLIKSLAVRSICDLDLLVFFARHPHTLLASEQLARFIGCGLTEMADSLDALLNAGYLKRASHPSYATRLYVFSPPGADDELLALVVRAMSTRDGRLLMRRVLARQDEERKPRVTAVASGPGPRLVRHAPEPSDDAAASSERGER